MPLSLFSARTPRVISLLLFVALCALLAYWITATMALRTLPLPAQGQVVQPQALETGAVRTLFGGAGGTANRDVRLLGVVADGPRGAAILAIEGGEPKVVRSGGMLGADITLVEVRPRGVVLERNGVRQDLPLPAVGVR